MLILVDDPNRENEGDIIVPADTANPEAINFMMRQACGIVCLAMDGTICDRLGLDLVPSQGVDSQSTPFTPCIDARTGITTGTSAHDRARTPKARLKIWYGAKDTCPACAPAMAVFWCAPATPKAVSIWRAWPVSSPPLLFAKSATSMVPWLGCQTCGRFRYSTI
jgi:hypothetical protein